MLARSSSKPLCWRQDSSTLTGSQIYCKTSFTERLVGIHVKSLKSSSCEGHLCGFFFFQFIFPSFAWCSAQKHNKAHLESSCVKRMVSSRASLECRASCLHKPGLAAVSRWNRSPPSRSRPSCFGKRCPGRRKAAVLLTLSSTINAMVPDTFFFTPPSPSLLLLLPLSFLTYLIWNPSSNSGRRGRTHQLLMYSQCREKRERRLSNV